MNNYPIWWDTTITVYNKYEDPETNIIRWYKHVITGAFWKYTGSTINIGETVLETNTTICRVRKDANFLEKYLWVELPNDEMGTRFTFGQGDIIVKGEVQDTIDEYTTGQRSSDIVAKYKLLQGCIEIQDVAINVGPGRCNEHYMIRGV